LVQSADRGAQEKPGKPEVNASHDPRMQVGEMDQRSIQHQPEQTSSEREETQYDEREWKPRPSDEGQGAGSGRDPGINHA
jgi:hypothetical protein